ncbi:hypothetical protein FQN60_006773 [Etheostoma spectabile]|uniref:Uncharacterized protein n=1 Tax=Etheostoma spectabile TaxID=54343 RepID=A0A5J5CHR1_9PERO|nr:hypothetical protein FQN60_006773 [Etheostoma spectabile]
MNLTVRLLH